MAERAIYFCSVLKNRSEHLKSMCASLAAMHNTANCHLVLADYASNDGDIRKILAELPFPSTLVTLKKAYFNRAQGLNYAANHTKATGNDILFFIDVDILVPVDFVGMLQTNVQLGHVWFPVTYSLHRDKPVSVHKNSRAGKAGAHGWWRTSGHGMCGFTFQDFKKVGQWKDLLGVTWGREDNDIAARTKNKGLIVVRDRCTGLFHTWHPNGHYKTKWHMSRKRPKGKVKIPIPSISLWYSSGTCRQN